MYDLLFIKKFIGRTVGFSILNKAYPTTMAVYKVGKCGCGGDTTQNTRQGCKEASPIPRL